MAKAKRDNTIIVTVRLTVGDLVKWHALAKKQGVTFERIAKEAVELAWLRGSTR